MSAAIRVLGISGSLRVASHNTALLGEAARLVGEHVRLDLWGGLRLLPPFNEDDEHEPVQAVQALREAIAEADALLIATPEYNGSVPGQLKNAIDWASRPYGDSVLTGKPVAVIGASVSLYGAAAAQAELRRVLGRAGARVLDAQLCVPQAHEAFGADGRLRASAHTHTLADLLSDLVQSIIPLHQAI